jgi:hypothetical protein
LRPPLSFGLGLLVSCTLARGDFVQCSSLRFHPNVAVPPTSWPEELMTIDFAMALHQLHIDSRWALCLSMR